MNGKRYIGSAKDFDVRWRCHRYQLRKGTHANRYLQAAWVKYGEAAFEYRHLAVCAPQDLITEEQSAIDSLSPEYNLSPTAGSTLGVRFTSDTKRKISVALKGKTLGRKRDRAAVEKGAAAHRGRKRPAETGEKIRARLSGRKRPETSPETRAKLSAALKGKPKQPHVIEALQAGRARHEYTDERRARMAASIKAQYADGTRSRERPPEYRAKLSAALKGIPHSVERRANQAAAQRGKKRGPYKTRGTSAD